MQPSEELFKLIHSLSRSEKRFFKISSDPLAREKNYIRLFDFIAEQKKYDESALKLAFQNEAIGRNLPSEKHHLYQQILKSLRTYHNNHSINSVLQKMLLNIEILYSKTLYKECEKHINKAKIIAIKNEKFHYLNEIVSWEYRLLEETTGRQNVVELGIESQQALQKTVNLSEINDLYAQVNHLFRTQGFVRQHNDRERIQQVEQHPLITHESASLSIRAKIIQHYTKGLCALMLCNFAHAYTSFVVAEQLLSQHATIKKDATIYYILILLGKIYALIATHRFYEAQITIKKLNDLIDVTGFDSIHATNWILFNAYFMELIWFQRQGEFQRSMPLIVKIDATFSDNHHQTAQMVLNFYKSLSFFGVGDLKTASHLLYRSINNASGDFRQDVSLFARVLNIIIQYELGNYELINYNIKSVERLLLLRGKEYYAVELTLIRAIQKLIKRPSYQQVAMLEKLKQTVLTLYEQQQYTVVGEYFELIPWINSKLNNTSYQHEVLQSLQRLNKE